MMPSIQVLRLTDISESNTTSPRPEGHNTVGAHDLVDHTQPDGRFQGFRYLGSLTLCIVKNIVSDLKNNKI
jgi:hypothetical protein